MLIDDMELKQIYTNHMHHNIHLLKAQRSHYLSLSPSNYNNKTANPATPPIKPPTLKAKRPAAPVALAAFTLVLEPVVPAVVAAVDVCKVAGTVIVLVGCRTLEESG